MGQKKWTLGLITSPRKNSYFLDRTLNSIKNSGLPDPNIFAEPNSIIPENFSGHIIHRRKQYGDWTNWASGLYELYLSEINSDYFLMIEDDCIFVKNIIEYLEYTIPLLPEFAYISLYTGKRFHRPKIKGFHNEARGWNTWSTVSILLTKDKIPDFLGNSSVMSHRRDSIGTPHENTSKDCVLGKWAESIKLPVFYHSPSLTEHIGWESTLSWAEDKDYTKQNYPTSKDFPGENFDVSKWVGKDFDVRNKRAGII